MVIWIENLAENLVRQLWQLKVGYIVIFQIQFMSDFSQKFDLVFVNFGVQAADNHLNRESAQIFSAEWVFQ